MIQRKINTNLESKGNVGREETQTSFRRSSEISQVQSGNMQHPKTMLDLFLIVWPTSTHSVDSSIREIGHAPK
jgi:hypothetical protein